jgi:hypothetical protein
MAKIYRRKQKQYLSCRKTSTGSKVNKKAADADPLLQLV